MVVCACEVALLILLAAGGGSAPACCTALATLDLAAGDPRSRWPRSSVAVARRPPRPTAHGLPRRSWPVARCRRVAHGRLLPARSARCDWPGAGLRRGQPRLHAASRRSSTRRALRQLCTTTAPRWSLVVARFVVMRGARPAVVALVRTPSRRRRGRLDVERALLVMGGRQPVAAGLWSDCRRQRRSRPLRRAPVRGPGRRRGRRSSPARARMPAGRAPAWPSWRVVAVRDRSRASSRSRRADHRSTGSVPTSPRCWPTQPDGCDGAVDRRPRGAGPGRAGDNPYPWPTSSSIAPFMDDLSRPHPAWRATAVRRLRPALHPTFMVVGTSSRDGLAGRYPVLDQDYWRIGRGDRLERGTLSNRRRRRPRCRRPREANHVADGPAEHPPI